MTLGISSRLAMARVVQQRATEHSLTMEERP